MAQAREHGMLLDVCTFQVGGTTCGVDILCVQEINSQTDFTRVPLAPRYVLGVTNLRGRVVTVIDLGKKLGLADQPHGEQTRTIIVDSDGELIGLMVDGISDVIRVPTRSLEPPPANVQDAQQACLAGVFRQGGTVIHLLDVTEVLREEPA